VVGKTGKARLDAVVKRLFSATFDHDVYPDDITIKRADLEAVLLVFKQKHMLVVQAPQMHPEQQ